jgi:hypothetical protein
MHLPTRCPPPLKWARRIIKRAQGLWRGVAPTMRRSAPSGVCRGRFFFGNGSPARNEWTLDAECGRHVAQTSSEGGMRRAHEEGNRRLPRASRHIQEQKALRACP